jgi:hypothetical protein
VEKVDQFGLVGGIHALGAMLLVAMYVVPPYSTTSFTEYAKDAS